LNYLTLYSSVTAWIYWAIWGYWH